MCVCVCITSKNILFDTSSLILVGDSQVIRMPVDINGSASLDVDKYEHAHTHTHTHTYIYIYIYIYIVAYIVT